MARGLARLVVLGLFAGSVVAYAAGSASLMHQHWDSLEYAHACETPGVRTVWGNHPLGHVVLCNAQTIARSVGYGGRALPLFQWINAFIGALDVVVFFVLLRGLGIAAVRALGWAIVFGTTYGLWHFTGTADVYVLAVLLVLVAWRGILKAAARPDGRAAGDAGVLLGMATLSHQFAGPVLVAGTLPVIPGLLRARPAVLRRFARMLLIAGAVALAGYVTLAIVSTHSWSPSVLWRWVVGYGSDPMYGRYLNAQGFAMASFSFTETLLRSPWTTNLEAVRVLTFALFLVLVIAAIGFASRLADPLRTASRSATLQLVAGWLLVAWWEPYHIGKFWLLVLPAFVVLLAAGLETTSGVVLRSLKNDTRGRFLNVMPFALASLVVSVNVTAIAREHAVNEPFEEALRLWAAHSQPDDVLIESDELTAHLLFWSRRPNTVNLYRILETGHNAGDPFDKLRATIDEALASGRAVILAPGLSEYLSNQRLAIVGTTRGQVEAFFRGYKWTGPMFTYQSRWSAERRQAYRLEK